MLGPLGVLLQANDIPLAAFPVKTESDTNYLQNLLQSNGLRTMITGDLRYSALRQDPCNCSYKLTTDCCCHEVILLVYGETEPPITLIIQCRGNWMCVYLCTTSLREDNRTTKQKLIGLLVPIDEQEKIFVQPR